MTWVVGAMLLVMLLPVLILAGVIKGVAITVEAATQRRTPKLPFKYVAEEERKRKRREQLRVRRAWKKVCRRIAREERASRQGWGTTLLRLSAFLMHLAVCHVGLAVALNGFVMLTHLVLVWPFVQVTVMVLAPAWRGRVTNVMERSLYTVALVTVCSGALTCCHLRWVAAEFVLRKGRAACKGRVAEGAGSQRRTRSKKDPERTPCQHVPRVLTPKAVENGGERPDCWERRVLDRERGGVGARKRRCERPTKTRFVNAQIRKAIYRRAGESLHDTEAVDTMMEARRGQGEARGHVGAVESMPPARVRGGASRAETAIDVEVACENPLFVEGIDVHEPEEPKECLAGAMQHPTIRGLVEGVPCIAAETCGDGACALHATWGRADPSKGMQLYHPHARATLLASLPSNALSVLGLYDGALRESFLSVMDSVWKDLVLPAARATLQGVACPSHESTLAWEALAQFPERVREELLGFVAKRVCEDISSAHRVSELVRFARDFFRPENEVDVVRPLCVLLGYLVSNDTDVDLLSVPSSEGELRRYEGDTGALELFHPCYEKPECTKYQVLFDASATFDKYRRAFFANTTHNACEGHQGWLLDALESLAAERADVGASAQAELLRRGCQVVTAYYNASSAREYPAECTPEKAWALLRTVLAQEGYWLSVQELQFLAACCGVAVDVYQFDEDAAEASPEPFTLPTVGTSLYREVVGLAEHVWVVYQGGAVDSTRGHFSRLFTEAAWVEEAVRADEDDPVASEGSDGEESTVSSEMPASAGAKDGDEDMADGERSEDAEDNDKELDEFSDISDNSDIFHVEVLPDGQYVETREDADLRVIRALSEKMRKFPLLPPCPEDPTKSFEDVASGIRLPTLHCAMTNCTWSLECPMAEHWQMEWQLYTHLRAAHRDEMSEVFARCKEENRDGGFVPVISYYVAAVSEREREHMPLIGPSVDRRTLALLSRLANSTTIQSMMCFCCAQLGTHVRSWDRMYRCGQHGVGGRHVGHNYSKGDICMFTVEESLLAYHEQDCEGFLRHFSRDRFRHVYATERPGDGNPFENAPELDDGQTEWLRVLNVSGVPVVLLCCPEDTKRCEGCRLKPEGEMCKRCQIPLCATCARVIVRKVPEGIPMALCNDNFWGYTTDIIAKYRVRWIEAAIVLPCWTMMLVCYVEGDRGHLLNEEVGKQSFRTRVRGSACSFHMPWEDILADLKRNCLDKDMVEIPRPAECLKYILRVHLTVAGVDLRRTLRQLHVRPHVLLLLLHFLIDRNHEVFRGKGSPLELKERMRTAVAREYPETEGHLPETEREGAIPTSILEALRAAEAEEEAGAPRAKTSEGPARPRARPSREKNATPGDGARPVASCLEDIRPHAMTVERSAAAASDPATLREGALTRYGDLTVETGNKFIPQWHGKYFSQIMPFVIPRMVSGPDFDPEKRWRRDKEAAIVDPSVFCAGFARRVEASCRTDWSALPIVRTVTFKWVAEHTMATLAPFSGKRGSATQTSAETYVRAAQNLFKHLHSGYTGKIPLN